MAPETAKRVLDALEAARRILRFTDGKVIEDFAADLLLRSAVERQLEIIGEALGKAGAMDPQVVKIIVDLPRMVGLRNRLIHGYDSVDDEVVWDITQTRVPLLIGQLKEELEKAGFPSRCD